MKRVLIPIGAIAAFLIATSSVASANNAMSTDALSAQVAQLSAQTQQLEKQIQVLRAQMKKKKQTELRTKKKKSVAKNAEMESAPVAQPTQTKLTHDAHVNPWNHFVTVTTTPFLGKATDYDGDDLLYNVSSSDEDLRLLKQKKEIENQMQATGYDMDRPILQTSGAVIGEGFSQNGFGTSTTSGVNLATAELDFNAIASSWASAFMSMDFNGAPVSSGNREPNSTIYLSRGFATIGNLNRFPVYFTTGLIYVPYGRFANDMVSTPLTISLARVRTPAALLGFSLDNGLRGSIYGFSGNQTSGEQPMFKQWGLNGAYKHKFAEKDSFSLGAGWISNVADAQGQQNTGLSTTAGQFGGFGVSTPTSANNNGLVHSVDGVDGNANLTLNRISLIGEYIGAAEAYSPLDMTFNGTTMGAQPQAMHAEVDYLLPFFARKYGTTLGFAYGQTWQALALNLPENSYSVFLNTSIWRETTEAIEFRHDIDYSATMVATGSGATTNIVGTGRSRNSVLAQVGVYF